jgi:hypothetical protein
VWCVGLPQSRQVRVAANAVVSQQHLTPCRKVSAGISDSVPTIATISVRDDWARCRHARRVDVNSRYPESRKLSVFALVSYRMANQRIPP